MVRACFALLLVYDEPEITPKPLVVVSDVYPMHWKQPSAAGHESNVSF
jgi:hypothetical protein